MEMLAPTIYPSMIARACSALDESPLFRDMPDGYLRVIFRIIKKINLIRLNSPIVASRSTIAQESGKSVETVHRVVKWLEERGLIERAQKARAGLRGSSSPLIPTLKLLDALLLTDRTHAGKAPALAPALRPERSAPAAAAPCAAPGGAQFETFGKLKLPCDLAWLVHERGLQGTGVLQLMKLAKQAKQRLSDVVGATRKYLEQLEGRRLYAYLRALLGSKRDFGQCAQAAATEASEQRQHSYLQEKAAALAGQAFRSRDAKLVVTVDACGMLLEERAGRRAARPMCQSFLDAIAAGRLIARRDA
ncbi:MAG: replication/maintenance protein RepL [Comamonas sp.]